MLVAVRSFFSLLAVVTVALSTQLLSAGATPVALAAPEYYTVAPGDTLTGVANRFGVNVPALVQANSLPSPDFLQIGQSLVIPGTSSGDGNTTKAQAATSPPGFLYVPYRTQFDGTLYQESNCGPAALGMALAYFGDWISTDSLRSLVNKDMNYWALDGGADWSSMVYTAATEGFSAIGPYDAPKQYHTWTVDELLQQVGQGRPAILLVRYPYLPGHEGGWPGDHYIVVLGQTANGDIVYHDSAFFGDTEGAYRIMSRAQLINAWGQTQEGIPFSAMVLNRPDVHLLKNAQ